MEEREIIASFRSTECPACGGEKRVKNSFCPRCYRSLPTNKQRALYRSFSWGYFDAFNDALAHLGPKDDDDDEGGAGVTANLFPTQPTGDQSARSLVPGP